MRGSRRSTVIAATGLSAALIGFTGLTAAPALAAAPTGRPVTAVVALSGSRAVTAPGVRVLTVLRHLHEEVVRGTPAALALLAHQPGVLGLRADTTLSVGAVPVARMTPAGTDAAGSTDGGSVYAPEGLGGGAGTAGAGYHVNVAVLDSGLTDTPALDRASGRVTDGVDVSGLHAGGHASTSGRFLDGYGHGTFLASLIAGGVDGGHVIGVAPGARIVVVKVANDQGDTSLSEVLAGLDWVAAHARAIQIVTVALAQVPPTYPAYGADPLTAGIEHVRDSGVLPVVAVGNTPGQVGDPGDDVDALTVGAADTSSGAAQVASFSGSGVVAGVSKPDLVAAGVHVLGEMPSEASIATDNPQGYQPNGLFRGSGSSMATAIAAGVAALYASTHPDATPLQVKAALRQAAQPLGASPAAGAGLVAVPTDAPMTGAGLHHWSGESGFNADAWNDAAWQQGNWEHWLKKAWSSSAWNASTWSASTWSASTWSASTWSASTWSASTWSASTWSASTWSASTWSASTWSDSSWGN